MLFFLVKATFFMGMLMTYECDMYIIILIIYITNLIIWWSL